jgi:hypothetical protein
MSKNQILNGKKSLIALEAEAIHYVATITYNRDPKVVKVSVF